MWENANEEITSWAKENFNCSLLWSDLNDFLSEVFPSKTPWGSLVIRGRHLFYSPQCLGCHINNRALTSYDCLHVGIWLNVPLLLFPFRISNEHSPKLQIRSHSYLRAVSEVSINRSLDSLDPAGLLTSPKFRSRNESYMRAMSTISQVSTKAVGHSLHKG